MFIFELPASLNFSSKHSCYHKMAPQDQFTDSAKRNLQKRKSFHKYLFYYAKKILFCFCTLYSQMMQVMKQAGQFLFLSFLFPINVFCKLGIFFHIYSSFLANFAVIKSTIQTDSSNFLHSQNIKFYTLIQYRILANFKFIFVVFD